MIRASRTRIRKNDIYIQGFKNAVYWVVQYIDDHDQLKKSVQSSLYSYVKDNNRKQMEIDPDIKKEYVNQKKYLESSHHSLQKRLEKEDQIHRQDNQNVMKDNIKLIDEIGELRRLVQIAHVEYKKTKNIQKKNAEAQKESDGSTVDSFRASGHGDETMPSGGLTADQREQETLNSLRREADMKHRYIAQMEQTLQ